MSARVRWRPPTRADIGAWAELLAAVEAEDRTGEHLGADDLIDDFASPGATPATDAILVLDREDLVGFGWAQRERAGARVLAWGAVHPGHRRRGIGTALIGWLERRAVAMAPARGGPVQLEVRGPATNAGLAALAGQGGYTPSRWWYQMQRRLDEALAPRRPAPAGISVQGFSPRLDEAVRLVHNGAFVDHWGSEPRSSEAWAQWFTGSRHFRGDLSLVAVDGSSGGDEVVGYLLSYVFEPDAELNGYTEGWVGQVGVRAPWRNKGLGRCLLAGALTAYRHAGLERAGLDVDTENASGALGLYQAVGFEPIKVSVSYTRLVVP